MSRYIDADEYVTVFLYDDEREEEYTERMTIAESLDHFTDEGCPQTIDAVEVVHGEWIAVSSYDAFGGSEELWNEHGNPTAFHYCSNCKAQSYVNEFGEELLTDYCPNCGAKMKGEDDDL